MSRPVDSEPGHVVMRGDSECAPESAMEMIGRQEGCARDFAKADIFECSRVDEVAARADAAVKFLAGGRLPARKAANAPPHIGVQKEQIFGQAEELLVHPESGRMPATGNPGDPLQYPFVAWMEMRKELRLNWIVPIEVHRRHGLVDRFHESLREKHAAGVHRFAGLDVERVWFSVTEYEERILSDGQAAAVIPPLRLPLDHRLD